MVGTPAALALVATEPSWALLIWCCGYAASGPVIFLIGLWRRKGDGNSPPPLETQDPVEAAGAEAPS